MNKVFKDISTGLKKNTLLQTLKSAIFWKETESIISLCTQQCMEASTTCFVHYSNWDTSVLFMEIYLKGVRLWGFMHFKTAVVDENSLILLKC